MLWINNFVKICMYVKSKNSLDFSKRPLWNMHPRFHVKKSSYRNTASNFTTPLQMAVHCKSNCGIDSKKASNNWVKIVRVKRPNLTELIGSPRWHFPMRTYKADMAMANNGMSIVRIPQIGCPLWMRWNEWMLSVMKSRGLTMVRSIR